VIRKGDEAPAFEGTIQDGSRVALADILERGPLVLYFYPKDFTPGRTLEARDFRGKYSEFTALGGSPAPPVRAEIGARCALGRWGSIGSDGQQLPGNACNPLNPHNSRPGS